MCVIGVFWAGRRALHVPNIDSEMIAAAVPEPAVTINAVPRASWTVRRSLSL